jgi:sugar phosphate isomerase/epimerase
MIDHATYPRFAVSQFTTWNLTFEQDLALYRQLKVDGIELCERKLSRDHTEARRQLALLRDSGLEVTSVQPRCHALFPDSMSPAPADPHERIELFKATIRMLAEFFPDQNLPLVTLTGAAPNRDLCTAYKVARSLYPDLCDDASAHGMRIMLEPLNPIFMNTDTFISTLKEAEDLVDSVRRDNFGFAIDTIHLYNEIDLPRRLAALGEKIFAVHISDAPKLHCRCAGDRLLPGDGCIDLPGIFGGIEASGYDGAYALEIFSAEELPDSIWRRDPAQVIEQARQGFQRAWLNRKVLKPKPG